MPTTSDDSQYQERPSASLPGPLRELTPHQIAEMIRGLDSRLTGIDYDTSAGEPVLMYRFELSGRREAFAVAVDVDPLTSVADLYSEADVYERALTQRYGVRFLPPSPKQSSDEERGVYRDSAGTGRSGT
jgi:hypothetical protein